MDGATVWTGSWNVTVNDTFRNDNNMLRIAQNYARKFEALFAGPNRIVQPEAVHEYGTS